MSPAFLLLPYSPAVILEENVRLSFSHTSSCRRIARTRTRGALLNRVNWYDNVKIGMVQNRER